MSYWLFPRKKLYSELGFESLHSRQWYRKLCYFYNVFKQPEYLCTLIPVRTSKYRAKNADDIPYFNIRHKFFKKKFSRLQLLNGKNWTLDFEKSRASLILGKIF